MNCLLKNIPSFDNFVAGDGYNGLNFPLHSICEILQQPDAPVPPTPPSIESCYLVLEEDGITFFEIYNEPIPGLSSIEILCP